MIITYINFRFFFNLINLGKFKDINAFISYFSAIYQSLIKWFKECRKWADLALK